MVIGRSSRLTHFLEWRDYKIIFKRWSAMNNIEKGRLLIGATLKKMTDLKDNDISELATSIPIQTYKKGTNQAKHPRIWRVRTPPIRAGSMSMPTKKAVNTLIPKGLSGKPLPTCLHMIPRAR